MTITRDFAHACFWIAATPDAAPERITLDLARIARIRMMLRGEVTAMDLV